MTDDGGFPDPGQMTTRVSTARAGRATPRGVPRGDGDVVPPDDWPDPGQDAASTGEEQRHPDGSGGGAAT